MNAQAQVQIGFTEEYMARMRRKTARPFRLQDLLQSYKEFEAQCDWAEAREARLQRELKKLADHNKSGPKYM